jgi:PAS domain S-box-containing protein
VDEDADRFETVSDTPGRPWSLFESIPEMVVVVDSDGRILYANHHCTEIVGWTPNELNGRSIETLVPDQLRGLHQSHRRGYTAIPRVGRLGSDCC